MAAPVAAALLDTIILLCSLRAALYSLTTIVGYKLAPLLRISQCNATDVGYRQGQGAPAL